MGRIWFIIHSGRRLALLAFLVLTCMWPALYNRQPLFYSDTPSYVRVADAGIAKITGHESVWSRPIVSVTGQLAGPRRFSNLNEKFVIGDRSVYYGALLYISDAIDQLWLTILLQAAAVVFAVSLTLVNMVGFSWFALTTLLVGLAVATPMAFFASFLMPDIFAGLTVLSIANLMAYAEKMTPSNLFIWVSLLSVALLFHTSHLFLALSILIFFGLGIVVKQARVSRKAVAGLAFGVAVALTGQAAFALGVTKILGATPAHLPYLTVRVIVDGPGAAYLKANCPQAGFAMCRFVDRLPIDHDTLFGILGSLDTDTRRTILAEQNSFVIAALTYDPIGETVAALYNTMIQLVSFRLDSCCDFDYSQSHNFFSSRVPEPYIGVMTTTEAWVGEMPIRLFSTLILVSTIVSTLYIGGFLVYNWRASGRSEELANFVKVILFGIVANAFICGAISDPLDRYGARVIWLVPLIAALVFWQQRTPHSTDEGD